MVPLDVAQVIKVARAYAHLDASRQFVEAAMAKIAAGEVHGALRSTTATAVGPSEALRGAVRQMATDTVPSVLPPSEAESRSVSPTYGHHYDSERLDALAAQGGLSEMDKEAFLGAARAFAQNLATKGGIRGRVGRLLSREVRAPVQVARTGPGTVSARVRSPVGPAVKPPAQGVPAGAAVATPEQAARYAPVPSGGPYRTPGRGLTSAEQAERAARGQQAVDDIVGQIKLPGAGTTGQALTRAERSALTTMPKKSIKPARRQPGLVRSVAGPLVVPGLLVGGGLAAKGVANFASQAANRPMPYSMGNRRLMYGYGPGGQAPF